MGSEMSTFNMRSGYPESILRGYMSALLGIDEYRRLNGADSLEDLRSALDDTEFSGFMQDEPVPLTVDAFARRLKMKLNEDFNVLLSVAEEPLRSFLKFITAEKMIDNTVLLLQGGIAGTPVDDLMSKLDPLGWNNDMKGLLSVDSHQTVDELCRGVLVETPVGGYFERYLDDRAKTLGERKEAVEAFSDNDLDLMHVCLKRYWLEDFLYFIESADINATTKSVMIPILEQQADFLTLGVVLNSIHIDQDRTPLLPSFGKLYPTCTDALRKCTSMAHLKQILEAGYPEYLDIVEQCSDYYDANGNRTGPSLEEFLYRSEMKTYEETFEFQMQYGVFYAWTKLREQEIRNILWIADMLLMGRKDHVNSMVLIPFSDWTD